MARATTAARPRPGTVAQASPGRRGGFSLLEVMIALGLLAFGVLAVTAAQLAAVGGSRQSRSRTAAMYLATERMEAILAMPSASVLALAGAPNDPANPIDPADGSGVSYNRSWVIQQDTPEVGMISVTVNVAWVDVNGDNRATSLQGLKADL